MSSKKIIWRRAQIKSFVDGAIREWGVIAWRNLGERLQRALIAERALAVVRHQNDVVRVGDVDALVQAMNAQAFGVAPTGQGRSALEEQS